MKELCLAMGFVLVSWAGLFLVFSGLGFYFCRWWGFRIQSAERWFSAFWLGWAGSIAFLQLWQLWFPVDWRALALLTMAGLSGLLWNSPDLWPLLKRSLRQRKLFWLAALLVVTWFASNSILPISDSDSGLYHLPSIRWAMAYPIVPGLGNLHGRLAFNQSYFLYVALLEVGFGLRKAFHFAGELLLAILSLQALLSTFKVSETFKLIQPQHLFIALFLPVVLAQKYCQSSPTSDTAIFVLGIVLSMQYLPFFLESKQSSQTEDFNLTFITTLAAIGTTVKISFVFLGGLIFLITLILWWQHAKDHNFRAKGKILCWNLGLGIVILLPWIIRGVILSGYIAYPSTVGAWPVDWRIPQESAINEANWIYSWARQPGLPWEVVLKDWNWLKPWIIRTIKTPHAILEMIFPLGIACLAFFSSLKTQKSRAWQLKCVQGLFLLPSLVAIFFWFILAPDVRFAGSCFWLLAIGSVLLVTTNFQQTQVSFKLSQKQRIMGIWVAILFFFALIIHKINLYGDTLAFSSPLNVETKAFITHSGLTTNVPTKDDCCWDAPLPCTPYPNAKLRLRKPGDLSAGFRLEP